jgi:hypothetical protein
MNRFPNFFIVGAARAGTTSFASYLAGHPDVYMSPVKEPHFFAPEVDPANFRAGFPRQIEPAKYLEARPLRRTHCVYVRDRGHYAALFDEAADEPAVGEASVSYLYSSVAAQRIREASPDARILVFLRNPIDRAYSHFLMDHENEIVGWRDFLAGVAADYASRSKGWGISNLYVELGLYYEQVKRFLDVFPRERVRVLVFDDYEGDPRGTLADIRRFLGLRTLEPDPTEYRRLNESRRTAHFPSIATNFRASPIGRLVGRLPAEIKKSIWTSVSRAPEPLPREARARLAGYFADDLARLSSLLGRDFSPWIEAAAGAEAGAPACGTAKAD